MKGGEDENTVVVGNMEMPFHKKYRSFDDIEKDTIKRMFYVACTRAKDILIINGFASKQATWFSNFSSSQ